MIDYVFWLQVAVNDLALVHVVQGSANLLHDRLHEVLAEFPLFLEEGVELPRAAQLLHEVDVLLVSEEGVQPHDVGVVQERLDFNLTHQLNGQFRLHIALRDAFQRADETRLFVASHEDLPEFA